MTQSVIGALRVNLGIDTAQFKQGLTQTQSALQRFGAKLRTILAAAATAAAAALAGLAASIRNTINEADQMSKAAQSVGMATEELSKLAWAADLSGVSFENLVGAAGKLSKSIGDALRSKTSEQAQAFNALGVSLTDASGNMRATRQVIDEIANRFAAMKDGTEKTVLAMALFGRSGKELIPLLNQGADGLKAMGDEAERLGIVIDTQTGRRAEAFNDTLNRISKIFKGVSVQITSEILPALQAVADGFWIAGTENDRMKSIVKGSVIIFKGLGTFVMFAVDSFRALSAVVIGAAEAIERLREGDYAGANARMEAAWANIGDIVRGFLDDVNEIWNRVDVDIADALVPDGGRIDAGLRRIGQQMADGASKIAKPLQDTVKGLDSAFTGIGDAIGSALNKTRSWSDVLKDVLAQVARLAFQNLGGSSPGGQFLSSLMSSFIGGLPRFANGGSFTVGGAGGVDSQFVGFMATPGETVDVRRPGQMAGGGRSVVEIRMSPDVEARVLQQAAGNAVQITRENNRRTLPGVAKGAIDGAGMKYGLQRPVTST